MFVGVVAFRVVFRTECHNSHKHSQSLDYFLRDVYQERCAFANMTVAQHFFGSCKNKLDVSLTLPIKLQKCFKVS